MAETVQQQQQKMLAVNCRYSINKHGNKIKLHTDIVDRSAMMMSFNIYTDEAKHAK